MDVCTLATIDRRWVGGCFCAFELGSTEHCLGIFAFYFIRFPIHARH